MVKFGTYSLPHVLSVQQQQGRVFQEIPLPGRPFPYRRDRGGMGSRFTVQGEIRATNQLARDQISALADGTARTLDLEKADLTVLEACLIGPASFGDFNQFNNDLGAGYLYGVRFRQVGSGKLTSISFWAHATGGVGVAIYSDNPTSITPVSPLTTKQTVTAAVGLNTVTMTSPNQIQLNDGLYYWIIFEIQNIGCVTYDNSFQADTKRALTSSWVYGSAFPDPWTGSTDNYTPQLYWTVAFIDDTPESQTVGGTPFRLLGSKLDYRYFGHREKFNKLQFALQTLGDYGLALWEYSKGGAWGTLVTDSMYDDFLGSTLDTSLWTVTQGTYSVGGGILTVNDSAIIAGTQTFGPYTKVTMRLTPKQTNHDLWVFAAYINDGTYIRLNFHWSGHLYCEASVNYTSSNFDAGLYTANAMKTYVILWAPGKIQYYADGVKLGELTGVVVPSVGSARVRFLTYGYPVRLDVDYVKTSLDDTNNFSRSGAVTFTPSSDWKQDTVNSIANKFWLRASVPGVTTPATVNQIQLSNAYNCIMLDPSFNETAENYNMVPYTATFVQQENP